MRAVARAVVARAAEEMRAEAMVEEGKGVARMGVEVVSRGCQMGQLVGSSAAAVLEEAMVMVATGMEVEVPVAAAKAVVKSVVVAAVGMVAEVPGVARAAGARAMEMVKKEMVVLGSEAVRVAVVMVAA